MSKYWKGPMAKAVKTALEKARSDETSRLLARAAMLDAAERMARAAASAGREAS